MLALDNITQTIKTKADAVELRKAILHLAVSGKLVPQITTEGTGEDLYKQVQAAKTNLLKKQKALSQIKEKPEVTFDIPRNWKWVRLGDFYDVRDGTHDTPKYTADGYPLVTK